MATVIVSLTMSLDGFIAGPNDDSDNPLGDGGMRLFGLVFRRRYAQSALSVGREPGCARATLQTIRVVEAPGVTHLYRVVK